MVAAAPEKRVRDVVEPVLAPAGLVLEDVRVRREGASSVVEVVLDVAEDVEGELDLDRVADATRLVSDALDDADVVPGAYTLEVSSRGVSRPLTARRHFARAVGRSVTVRTADGATLSGRLTALERDASDGDAIVVVPVTPGLKGRRPKVGDPVRVPLADVRDAHVEVDLSGLGPDDEHGTEAQDADSHDAGQEG